MLGRRFVKEHGTQIGALVLLFVLVVGHHFQDPVPRFVFAGVGVPRFEGLVFPFGPPLLDLSWNRAALFNLANL